MKVTDWIPAEVKPKIAGWYERNYGDPNCCNDYWDGEKFIVVVKTINGEYAYVGPAKSQLAWRGLAEKP